MKNNSMDLSVIGYNIKKIREMEKISQSEVARYLGVDQSLISKFESGERTVSADMLEKLTKLFCLPISFLTSSSGIIPQGKVAFRTDGMRFEDMCNLAEVNTIILNQLEMDRINYGD